jgi:hypothetical protein
MQKHAHLAALGHARHGVGHVQADALLAHDDRPDVDRGAVFDQMIDGIGEEILDPLALQDFGDGRAGLHLRFLPFFCRVCAAPVARTRLLSTC